MSDNFFMAMIVIAIVCASLSQAFALNGLVLASASLSQAFALNGLVLASASMLTIGAICVYAIK